MTATTAECLLTSHQFAVGLGNLGLNAKPDAQGVKNLGGSFQRDAMVFIAFISRDLRLVNAKPFGKVLLRRSSCNSQANQQMTKPAEVLQFINFAAF